jgi:hypothetical protein
MKKRTAKKLASGNKSTVLTRVISFRGKQRSKGLMKALMAEKRRERRL